MRDETQAALDLLSLLQSSERDFRLGDGRRARPSVLREIERLRPIVETEARRLGISPCEVSTGTHEWEFRPLLRWLNEYLGFLSSRDSGGFVAVFPCLDQVMHDLDAGRFGDAVFGSGKRLESELRLQTKLNEAGQALVGRALGRSGVLEIRVAGKRASDSYQDGVKLLAMGAFAAFRNPLAHGEAPVLSREEAIVQVTLFDYLFKLISESGHRSASS